MNKTHFLSLAAASALASTAAIAAPSINFYGDLDASINHTDVDSASPGTSIDIESFESKIGVTGGEPLGNGMRAFYRAEFGFNAANGGDLGTSGNHERYVGLVTYHGKIRVGTIASPHDDVVGVTDAFQNKHAVQNYSLLPNLRTNNTIRFDGGNEDGLSYSVAVTANGAANVSTVAGTKNPGAGPLGNENGVLTTGDEEADIWTAAIKHSSGNFSAGFAHTSVRGGDSGASTQALNGLGLALDLDAVDLALTYEVSTQNHNSTDNIFLTGTFALCEKTDMVAGYGMRSDDASDIDRSTFVIAAHRALSANTIGYAEYSSISTETAPGSDSSNNLRWVNIGVRHTFGDNGRAVVRAK